MIQRLDRFQRGVWDLERGDPYFPCHITEEIIVPIVHIIRSKVMLDIVHSAVVPVPASVKGFLMCVQETRISVSEKATARTNPVVRF